MSTQDTTHEAAQGTQERPEDEQPTQDTQEGQEGTQEPQEEPETFPRAYVEQLRTENAHHRTRARQADDLARRLHTELVRATGRLADPTDLPFSEDHLEDVDDMEAAIDELLGRKPHLASRRPIGDVGQGAAATADVVDLAGILRANAG